MKIRVITVIAVSLVIAYCAAGQTVTNAANGDATHTPQDHNPRAYFKQADYSAFAGIKLEMTRDKVRELCGGHPYLQIETVRGNFAFSVDSYPSGILALPCSVPLNQDIDFFVGTELKKVLVVFYKELKADRILIFDFATMKWGQWPNKAPEPTATAPTVSTNK
jgi:hypothetical protein